MYFTKNDSGDKPLYYADIIDGKWVSQQTNMVIPETNILHLSILFNIGDDQYLLHTVTKEIFHSTDKVNFTSKGIFDPIPYSATKGINYANESGFYYFADGKLCKFDGNTIHQYDVGEVATMSKYFVGYCKKIDAIVLYALNDQTYDVFIISNISSGDLTITKSYTLTSDNYRIIDVKCNDNQIIFVYYEKNTYDIYSAVTDNGIDWESNLIHKSDHTVTSIHGSNSVISIDNVWLITNPFNVNEISHQFVYTSADGKVWTRSQLNIPLKEDKSYYLSTYNNDKRILIGFSSGDSGEYYQFDGNVISKYRYVIPTKKWIRSLDGLLYFVNL